MLAVEEVGEGAPLVLLHPVGTAGCIWWQHMSRLGRQYHVFAIDLPGHGRSPIGAAPLSLRGMAEELHSFLQSRQLPPAHLVGLSIGGMVAQVLAVEHPSDVASLLLCDTICEVAPGLVGVLEQRARTVEEMGMAAAARPTVDRWFAPGFEAAHPEVVRVVEELLLAADPMVNAQCWRAIGHLDVLDRLSSVRVPSLVVTGEFDTSIAPGSGDRLASLLGSTHHQMAGCAHMAPIEAPESFMDMVEQFLHDQATGPGVGDGSSA
ncbi:MAG: alpha/beta fold hydrolase [Chloroflexota bacterium]